MIEDLGDGIKPYLRSFYESVRHYPGFDSTGMDTATDIEAAEKPEPKPEPKKAKKTKSQAPEHQAVGLDDRELAEVVGEFNSAQQSMLEDEWQMHHLFDPTPKKEVVRLQNKVKAYNKTHGWMTPSEAKARIAEWKKHAADQTGNSQRVVLSFFDLTGKWSQPWEDAGS